MKGLEGERENWRGSERRREERVGRASRKRGKEGRGGSETRRWSRWEIASMRNTRYRKIRR